MHRQGSVLTTARAAEWVGLKTLMRRKFKCLGSDPSHYPPGWLTGYYPADFDEWLGVALSISNATSLSQFTVRRSEEND